MSATIIYRRVSTIGQVEGAGDSLTDQLTKAKAWCAYQGLPEPIDYCDAGISGSHMENRPGFLSAIRHCLSIGPGCVLIVAKIDRLGRSSLDVQETIQVLLEAGVRIVSLADGIDSASGLGAAVMKLLCSIMSAFADLERSTINDRLQGGRRRAKERGLPYTREPPYGTKVVDGKMVDDEYEQNVINQILSCNVGGMSIGDIAHRLLMLGFKPRRGQAFSKSLIWRLTGKKTLTKPKQSVRLQNARQRFLESA